MRQRNWGQVMNMTKKLLDYLTTAELLEEIQQRLSDGNGVNEIPYNLLRSVQEQLEIHCVNRMAQSAGWGETEPAFVPMDKSLD